MLTPTRIYVKTILGLTEMFDIKGIAHITGGGFYENIPRIFPEGVGANINMGSWDMPQIFKILTEIAELKDKDAYSTFNMGIGMVLAADKAIADDVIEAANSMGEKAFKIGYTIEGSGVELCR